MKGPSYRFKLVRDTTEDSHLRFYMNYMYYQRHNELLNGYDLSVMQKRGLKHHFTEMMAEELDIETEALETGELDDHKKRELNTRLNGLLIAAKKYMLPNWRTSWLNCYRAVFFLYSAINVSIKSNILITNKEYSNLRIGQSLWFSSNSVGQKERERKHEEDVRTMLIEKRIREEREKGEKNAYLPDEHFQKMYRDDESLTEEVTAFILQEKQKIENRRLIGDPYIEALSQIENYDPVNDDHALEKMIDHFNFIAFTKEAYRAENENFLKQLEQLYRKCYKQVSSSHGVVRNENPTLIDHTYDRLIRQYDILRFYPSTEVPMIRQECIVAFLDILSATTCKDEFKERLKLIGDKFSLDKKSSPDFTISLSQKQWGMLIDIADSKFPSKIKQALNKMIRTRHKEWKQESKS
ncbi:hypothetical protein F0224_23035 [Vibrio coralliilyticus]|nr:hypothetical protein [Vibrio coralliilyticus]PAW00874.1 hypothetical protein CKJ79_24515 [Vibrio coralliilyticus]